MKIIMIYDQIQSGAGIKDDHDTVSYTHLLMVH